MQVNLEIEELRESLVVGHRVWVNSDSDSLRMLVDLLNNFIDDEAGGVTNCLSLQTDNDAGQLMFLKASYPEKQPNDSDVG